MSDCVTRSITGHVSPLSTIPRVALAMPLYANAVTPTDVPCAVLQIDCLAWPASFCSDRRHLIRIMVDRRKRHLFDAPKASSRLLEGVSQFGLSAVSRSRPAIYACVVRSGGQDWPKTTAFGRREAALTAASTARGSIGPEALPRFCRPTALDHSVTNGE